MPDSLDPFDAERPRGILTKRERKYLLGESDIDPNSPSERSVRQSIRRHLIHTMLDFPLIYREMSDRDLNTVFTTTAGATDDQRPPVQATAADLIALLYRAYGSEYRLERLVKDGIEREAAERGEPVHARVSIDLFPDEVAEIKQRFDEQGVEAVSHRDLGELWEAGHLTDDEFIETMGRWADRHETEYENRYEHPGGTLDGEPVERARLRVEAKQNRREKTRKQRQELASESEETNDE
jgi:hypothetical protein